MALTITTISKPHKFGDRWRSASKVVCDNSYATGGYSLKPTDLGFAVTTDDEWHVDISGLGGGLQAEYDYTNQKLLVKAAVRAYTATFDPASLAATTARDDAITVTGVAATDICIGYQAPAALAASIDIQEARVSGANTITVRHNNASAGAVDAASGTYTFYVVSALGAAYEIANAADLSAVSFRVEAYSKYRA
jgi:hypothetical protein